MSKSARINLENFDSMVGEIYEAALDQTRWSKVLARISQALNARSGILRAQNLSTKEVGTFVLHNIDPAYQRQYVEHYIHVDTLVPIAAAQPVGRVMQTTTHMPGSFFKGEFYNDFALPQKMGHTMGCVVTRNRSALVVMGFHREDPKTRYSSDELNILQMLTPHLQRAFQINRRLWELQSETDAMHETLHRFEIGVILVDAAGKPLFLNKWAETIVATGNGLTISRNVLRATTWSDTEALHHLISEAARTSQRNGGSMTISDPVRSRPVSILAVPVGREHDTVFQVDSTEVAAALIIGAPEQQHEFCLDALCDLYELTRAEARLAAALANGQSLDDVAERFDVSLHTVRSQLKACFRKTGASRQAELVKLVLCAPAAMVGGNGS